MSFPDLRAFLGQLQRDRSIVTVEAPVDAHLEVAEIHRRVIAAGGPALLFTNVEGRDFRLVTNLFGTARRAELAFGERPLRLIKRIVALAETLMPPAPGNLWGARDVGLELLKVGTRRVSSGPVTARVASDVRLDRLPVITSWPEDGGPFITLPLVYTTHPDRHGHNLGMYRMHVHDARNTGMRWRIGKGGGYHYAVAEARGESLPVTVMLGGPPALILSAIAPLPENVPELMLASLIAGERLPQVHGQGAHPLVASAEFALMGEVAPGVRKPEGPFGDHYGYYSLQHDYPVFTVQRMAHRADAIYPATVVGKPRQEDFFIGDLLQDLLSPLFPLVMPAVEQLWSYGETGYHSLGAAVVKQRYAREAMASAFRILGEGQLSLTKFLLVTDRHVELRDFKTTLEHVLARRLEVAQFHVAVGDEQELGERQLPFAQDAERARHRLPRIALLHHRGAQRVVAGLAIGPQLLHRGHHQRKERRQQLLQQIADEEVLLPRLPHHRRRIDRVPAVRHALHREHRVVVRQRVVAVVVAEGPFGLAHARRHLVHERELGRRDERVRALTVHLRQPLAGDERGEHQLGYVLGQRCDGRQNERRRAAEHDG